jgi:hypothetical protein
MHHWPAAPKRLGTVGVHSLGRRQAVFSETRGPETVELFRRYALGNEKKRLDQHAQMIQITDGAQRLRAYNYESAKLNDLTGINNVSGLSCRSASGPYAGSYLKIDTDSESVI